jgi:hypothetical protein
MHHQPSRAETLVLHTLYECGSLPLEHMTERIPELSWSEVFHAVDRLSRKGEVVLRRRGFAYHLSLPALSQV